MGKYVHKGEYLPKPTSFDDLEEDYELDEEIEDELTD